MTVNRRWDAVVCLLLLVTALAARLPYWKTIPAAGDEFAQVLYAYRIAEEGARPLVGNDDYAGPFFFYLLAGLIKLGFQTPFIGRAVTMVAGAFTVAGVYLWARALRLELFPALVAALLVLANPHQILINSHLGGTTHSVVFFSTFGLFFLTLALERDSPAWLLAAAVMGGLALQANLIAAPLLAGAGMWLTVRIRRLPRLGRGWPAWAVGTAVGLALVYSPVIVYNVSNRFETVQTLQARTHLAVSKARAGVVSAA